MASFFADKFNFSATPIRIVEAIDFDREVVLRTPTDTANVKIGFTEAEVDLTQPVGFPLALVNVREFRMVLPAGQELWANGSGSGATLHLLVTGLA